jgi:hypothetical protein
MHPMAFRESPASGTRRLYGDLAGVRQAAQRRDPATRASIHDKVLAAHDYLDAAPIVVRVATDIAIDGDDFTLVSEPANREELERLSARYNLTSSVSRVLKALSSAPLGSH